MGLWPMSDKHGRLCCMESDQVWAWVWCVIALGLFGMGGNGPQHPDDKEAEEAAAATAADEPADAIVSADEEKDNVGAGGNRSSRLRRVGACFAGCWLWMRVRCLACIACLRRSKRGGKNTTAEDEGDDVGEYRRSSTAKLKLPEGSSHRPAPLFSRLAPVDENDPPPLEGGTMALLPPPPPETDVTTTSRDGIQTVAMNGAFGVDEGGKPNDGGEGIGGKGREGKGEGGTGEGEGGKVKADDGGTTLGESVGSDFETTTDHQQQHQQLPSANPLTSESRRSLKDGNITDHQQQLPAGKSLRSKSRRSLKDGGIFTDPLVLASTRSRSDLAAGASVRASRNIRSGRSTRSRRHLEQHSGEGAATSTNTLRSAASGVAVVPESPPKGILKKARQRRDPREALLRKLKTQHEAETERKLSMQKKITAEDKQTLFFDSKSRFGSAAFR